MDDVCRRNVPLDVPLDMPPKCAAGGAVGCARQICRRKYCRMCRWMFRWICRRNVPLEVPLDVPVGGVGEVWGPFPQRKCLLTPIENDEPLIPLPIRSMALFPDGLAISGRIKSNACIKSNGGFPATPSAQPGRFT